MMPGSRVRVPLLLSQFRLESRLQRVVCNAAISTVGARFFICRGLRRPRRRRPRYGVESRVPHMDDTDHGASRDRREHWYLQGAVRRIVERVPRLCTCA